MHPDIDKWLARSQAEAQRIIRQQQLEHDALLWIAALHANPFSYSRYDSIWRAMSRPVRAVLEDVDFAIASLLSHAGIKL